MTNKEQLAADLFASFQDFQTNAPTPGGSLQANQYVADKLADAIGDGIERGSRISFKGAKTVAEINYLPSDQKQAGDMYLCTTSGRLDGKNPLEVNENTAVIWDGESWSKFIEIDLSDYYTKEEVDGAVSLLQAEIGEHKEDTSNPHQVTAEQVGADPAGTAERLVEEHNLSEDSHLDIRQAILDESDARQAADETLQGNIDAETSARENADATLQGNIDAEETAREDADATLQSNIESEATEREQADSELQAQIDAISSRSDVVDVVASYAELVAYDTSTLADNDVIKVLADETHEDAIAYYRWSTTTEAWSFIGSQGPYYTISEADALLAGKVDKVSGKGLSTNDYTTAEKNKLAGIETGAQVNNIFVAVYIGAHNNAGNTPYADINAAYQAGKRLLCWNSASNALRLYTLNGFNATDKIFKFTACGGSGEDILEVSFAYLEGNINDTECRTNNYLLAKRNHASSDTTYGTGTSSNYGHVKLSASTSSTSGVNDGVAATPSAVKAVKDIADSKYSIPSGGVPYSDMSSGVKASLDKADTALQQQDISGKLDKTGDGKDVTVTFTETSSMTNVVSGDTLDLLFGKVSKWFSNLKYLAFQESVTDDEISGKISDAHIASASTWNGKADKSHASSTTAYGTGTSSNYGHVKLSDDTDSSSGASDGVAATPLAVQNAYKRIGYAYGAYFAQDSTAVGVELLRLNVSSNNATGSFLVRINNRNPASGKYGEVVALLSLSQRSGNLHLSFMSLVPRGFNGTVTKTSPYRTPNTYEWRIGYRRYTVGTTTDRYDIYLWAVDQTGSANPVTIPFSEIRLTPLDHPDASYVVGLNPITSVPTYDDFWNLTYPVTHRNPSGVGSADRPVFMTQYGDVDQCSFMVNRGSHSTVTLDFTGTLGSNANTWYFV